MERSYQVTNHQDGTSGVTFYQGTDQFGRYLHHHYEHYDRGNLKQMNEDIDKWLKP